MVGKCRIKRCQEPDVPNSVVRPLKASGLSSHYPVGTVVEVSCLQNLTMDRDMGHSSPSLLMVCKLNEASDQPEFVALDSNNLHPPRCIPGSKVICAIMSLALNLKLELLCLFCQDAMSRVTAAKDTVVRGANASQNFANPLLYQMVS